MALTRCFLRAPCATASAFSLARYQRPSSLSPTDVVAHSFKPRSMPTLAVPTEDLASTSTNTCKYHRPRILRERAGAQFVLAQAVAVPEVELLASEPDLSRPVLGVPALAGNPAQGIPGRLGVADAPVQTRFLELLAPRGVLGADQLHGGAAAGFVAEIEHLIDLARHLAEHAGVP